MYPDHILTGIAQDVLTCCYRELGDDKMQYLANASIVDALTSNGLIKQRTVFNQKKKTLESMKLSAVFSVLVAAVPVLNHITFSDHNNTLMCKFLSLMVKLQKLIAYNYCCPEVEVNGEQCVDFFIGNYRGDYIDELRLLSKDYVRSVHLLCSESHLAGNFMDKPNIHRLIELYEVSIQSLSQTAVSLWN